MLKRLRNDKGVKRYIQWIISGADLEHNLGGGGGGQEHARGTGRASGERCGKVSPSPCEARKL